MSRIGRSPIAVPAGVTVTVEAGNQVTVKGPKGTLTQTFHPDMTIEVNDGVVHVTRPDDEKNAQSAARFDPFALAQYGGRRDGGIFQNAGNQRRRLQSRKTGQQITAEPGLFSRN